MIMAEPTPFSRRWCKSIPRKVWAVFVEIRAAALRTAPGTRCALFRWTAPQTAAERLRFGPAHRNAPAPDSVRVRLSCGSRRAARATGSLDSATLDHGGATRHIAWYFGSVSQYGVKIVLAFSSAISYL